MLKTTTIAPQLPLDYRSVFVLLQQLPEALADQYKLQQSSKKRTKNDGVTSAKKVKTKPEHEEQVGARVCVLD